MNMKKNKPIQENLFNNSDISWMEKFLKTLEIKERDGWQDEFGVKIHEWISTRKNKEVNVLSLFSGAGGLDVGFHQAGFNIIECVEIEGNFTKTLIRNVENKFFGNTKVNCIDINEYQPKLDEKIDFIIGGPPCQTFSAAGARAAGVNGTDDERGNLFLQYARLIDKLQPAGFLFENVYRIVGAQNGTAWKKIQESFLDLGYKLHWRILDSADYGVPQFRERLIIVGLKEGKFLFPRPSHGPDSTDNRPYFSAGQAIENAPKSDNPTAPKGRHGHLLNEIPPGLNYSFYTDRMKHPTPFFAWRSKFSDYLYKADPETPVRTIKAQGGQYTGPFSWSNRPFTTGELKRLQTFPDNYEIVGARQKVIHQIGNSVPPHFARILGLAVRSQVFKLEIPCQIDLLNENEQLTFRARKCDLTKIYEKKAKDQISKISSDFNNSPINMSSVDFLKVINYEIVDCIDPDSQGCLYVEQTFADDVIDISVKDNQSSESMYAQIIIKLMADSRSANGFAGRIKIRIYSKKIDSILVAWKALERKLKHQFYKDDLVQFFGYYKTDIQHSIEMEVFNEQRDDPLWSVLCLITNGIGTQEIKTIEHLSALFNFSAAEIYISLNTLKSVGYEIRNHNTNKQIKFGQVLIPYRFPSLTSRSLQGLTNL